MTIESFKLLTDEYINNMKEDIIEYDGTVGEYLSDLLIELDIDGADTRIINLFGNGDTKIAYKKLKEFYQENYNYRLK